MRRSPKLLRAALGALLLGTTPVLAAQGPVAHDVVAQIEALDSQPTPMAFWRGAMPLPGPLLDNKASHFQGIARHPDPAARVLYVSASSGSGGTPTLAAVKIQSADLLGSSRLRSNRLVSGVNVVVSPPFGGDEVVWWKEVDHFHPGGMQAAGDYLAVPYTGGYVEIYDISNPIAPQLVDLNTSVAGQQNLVMPSGGNNVGAVGFIQRADGSYLLMAAVEFGALYWFETIGDDITTLAHVRTNSAPHDWPHPASDYCSGSMVGGQCTGDLDPPTVDPWAALFWPPWVTNATIIVEAKNFWTSLFGDFLSDNDLFGSFNNYALLQDAGGIYLAGMWNNTNLAPVLRGTDILAVYYVDSEPAGPGVAATYLLELASAAGFQSAADDVEATLNVLNDQDAYCGNFNAGSTVWVSPEGELLVYTVEHYAVGVYNYNAATTPLTQQDYVAFGEYHNPRDPFLPATNETAHVVLYSEPNFGGYRVEWTFADHLFEDWAHFSTLPGPCGGFFGTVCDFSNVVQSFSWKLPPGMVVELYEDESWSGGKMILSNSGSAPVMQGTDLDPFWKNVASLEIAAQPLPEKWILHGYTDPSDARQVLSFPATTPLSLGTSWSPIALKLESGTYKGGVSGQSTPLVLDFPTLIQALDGATILTR
ncbi:hypothetical protein [Engelhardtia mirabilis]|uniref:Uncharacterized protein n=1 Tax=Engelhardtia mirabilis TaxID=2528011 RepID=A0A518BS00_9BACT|nr:hypothetical protein Pla133_48740 [Planctomycetes bacterium Pla133]QDV04078.1 hypothetical protein Pla86_48720 [Planctomycetes bacterium Pla86]